MSLKKSFMDNEIYGADDINFALSRLTTQGVSLFKYNDGDNPLVSLNNALAEMASPGVDLYNVNACKVIYDSETEKFAINPGTVFMPDGSFITVEDNPENITDVIAEARENVTGSLNVYFYRNTQKNTIEIVADSSGNDIDTDKSVLLAEISQDNKVLDKRSFAQSRIAPASGNIIQTIDVPSFTARYIDSGTKYLRKEFAGIFNGASYCVYHGTIVPIQKTLTEDGSGLTYTKCDKASSDSRCFVSLNLVGTTLQFWMYTEASIINTNAYTAYIF